MTEMATMQT